jgi:trk system potassium uptake protein TrkA
MPSGARVISHRFVRTSSQRRSIRRLQEQEADVHVVVIGCGRVGTELAGALEQGGHAVAVVDKNGRAFRRLPRNFQGKRVVGFGFDRDHLAEAGIEEAGAFASVTNGDNSNILCARIARETYGIERVVARIYDPRRALIYQRLGIPTVATVAWTTDQVLRRLLPAETRHDWVDATGKVGLVERQIPAKAVGRKLSKLNVPGRFWLTAVTRFGKAQIVTSDLVGQEGDVLVFVSSMDALDELQDHIDTGGSD